MKGWLASVMQHEKLLSQNDNVLSTAMRQQSAGMLAYT